MHYCMLSAAVLCYFTHFCICRPRGDIIHLHLRETLNKNIRIKGAKAGIVMVIGKNYFLEPVNNLKRQTFDRNPFSESVVYK